MSCFIKKHEIAITSNQNIKLPLNDKIMKIGTEDGVPYVYVLTYPDSGDTTMSSRPIIMYDTGAEVQMAEPLAYMGTIEDYRGIVKHVFAKPICMAETWETLSAK